MRWRSRSSRHFLVDLDTLESAIDLAVVIERQVESVLVFLEGERATLGAMGDSGEKLLTSFLR